MRSKKIVQQPFRFRLVAKELLISLELEESYGATKLKLTHEGIPEEMHDECIKGWNESFDKLEIY